MRKDFLIPSQAQLKKWARLEDGKIRRSDELFLAEGVKVVEELLASDWQIKALLVMPDKEKQWGRLSLPDAPDIPTYQLTRSQWERIGQDREPEGIMAIVSMRQPLVLSDIIARSFGSILILHEVNNPRNLGALARSSLWFGFNTIILSANSADFTNPKALRASMGSLFHLTILPDVDLAAALPEIKKNYFLIGSDVREGSLPHPVRGKSALLLGNESHGLPESILQMTDEKWSIPGSGKAESLSLPQAAAIMMYESVKSGS